MTNIWPCHLNVAKTLFNTQNMKFLRIEEFKTPMLLNINMSQTNMSYDEEKQGADSRNRRDISNNNAPDTATGCRRRSRSRRRRRRPRRVGWRRRAVTVVRRPRRRCPLPITPRRLL